MNTFTENFKVVRHSNAVAAGTTDIEPAAGVDTAGFETITFIVAFGAITANAVTSIKAQCSTESDGAVDTFADLAGTSVAVADDDDNQLKYLEIHNPPERYVRCVVDRGTANAVVDGIIAILSNPHEKPVTQPTGVEGEAHTSPAEGTA